MINTRVVRIRIGLIRTNATLAKEALMSFGNKKAAGPDKIKPIVFDYLPDNFIRHLVFIFKCVIKLRYTPCLLYTSDAADE